MDEAHAAISILGTGLMGGSLGLAVSRIGIARRITGYDLDLKTAKRALDMGAITDIASDLAEAVSGSSIVFISTPVGTIPQLLAEISEHLRPGTVVTDVGSTKSRIVEEAARVMPSNSFFVGGHPLAGSEKEGIEAAEADLYEGCIWFVTPTQTTDPDAYKTLVRFLAKLEARVLSLDPLRHDELVALTSHLPQLLSSALMGFAAEIAASESGLPLVTAGGFRDMTRIAASSPDLWVDIVRENRNALLDLLDRFQQSLDDARGFVEQQQWEALRNFLEAARVARLSLPTKSGLAPAEVVEILVPIPDRPGALAHVTTTLGESGVNIEDIDIVHSPEGGRGTIHIFVSGIEASRSAAKILEEAGYQVDIR